MSATPRSAKSLTVAIPRRLCCDDWNDVSSFNSLGFFFKPLSHLRTDAADRSEWSTDEISRKEYGDSTEFCLHQPKLAETVRREYGASKDAVAGR